MTKHPPLDAEMIDGLIDVAKRASTDGWGPYSANVPFYATVRKPRASLSKHDSPRSTHWHIDDAIYLTVFQPKNLIPLLELLKQICEENQ